MYNAQQIGKMRYRLQNEYNKTLKVSTINSTESVFTIYDCNTRITMDIRIFPFNNKNDCTVHIREIDKTYKFVMNNIKAIEQVIGLLIPNSIKYHGAVNYKLIEKKKKFGNTVVILEDEGGNRSELRIEAVHMAIKQGLLLIP